MLKVNMLGGFSIWSNEQLLMQQGGRLNKPLELFVLLTLHHHTKLTNEMLMEMLWGDETVENPAGALKNAVYSLRKLLQPLCSEVQLITTRGKCYCWNPDVPLELDVEQFRKHYQKIKNDGLKQQVPLAECRQTLALYQGDLLSALSDRHWVIPLAGTLKRQYLDLVEITSSALLGHRTQADAEEAMTLCQQAIAQEPLAEALYFKYFQAMQQLGMKSAVLSYYPVVENLFLDELGETLPPSLQSIYQWAAEQPNRELEDIDQVQKELEEGLQQENALQGAYFCPYEVFRHMYHVLIRSSVRSEACVLLFLATLLPLRGKKLPEGEFARSMLDLKMQIGQVLRKGDVYCRYSHNQYLLVLAVRHTEDADVVVRRLCTRYQGSAAANYFRLDVGVSHPEGIV